MTSGGAVEIDDGGRTDARDDDASDTARLIGAARARRRRNTKSLSRVSTPRLIGMNAFFFAYGAWISSFAIVTLPYEATMFFPKADSVALGAFMVIAGASQLSGPWAGYVSDRSRHAMGRRRPMIARGAMCVGPCLVMMFVARTYVDALAAWAPTCYYLAFTLTMVALNVMYTAATGLVPDIVPEEQTGESNGVLAAMSAAGACASFVYTMVYPDVSTLYFFYTGLLVTCVPITCYCANESSSLEDEEDEERNDESSRWDADVDFSWRELAQSYVISPTAPEQKSFFWLFICRTLYYTGISAQVFLQYLLRDTAVKDDGSGLTGREPQQTVARLSFIGQVGGMLCAYPAGLLSDALGRRPLIVVACVGIISVYIMFMRVHNLTTIMYIGAYYGAMNGMFLSVDYALAIDCLPSREDAARWLAIWGVASFIGTSIGPTMFSLILHFAPPPDEGRVYGSSQAGYDAMLLAGAAWMALCAAFLHLVRPNKLAAR